MRLLFILICICGKVYGQYNDTINYYINYGGTGILNHTNDGNNYNLNNNLKFNISKKSVSVNTTNNWIYGEQKIDSLYRLTNNDFSSAVDFNLFKTLKNFYYWGYFGLEKSYSLKIDNRLQTGLGIGYSWIINENLVIVLSNGILYERNDLFDLPYYETIRNSFRLKFRITIKKILILEGSEFLQHSLRSEKDHVIKSINNINLKIYKGLSFTSAITYNKLNLTSKETLLITFGASFEKYF